MSHEKMASSAGNSNNYTNTFPRDFHTLLAAEIYYVCFLFYHNILKSTQSSDLIKLLFFTDSYRAFLKEIGI